MAKDKTTDQFMEMQFPLNGLYLARENETPPPTTTPIGINVRTFETLTGRGRGGSRPGLKRYIDDQLYPGVKIQHLAVIVDPQAAALFGGVGSDSTTDPSRNTDGGVGGYPPVRHPIQGGRSLLINFQRNLITITANDQTKTYGDTFTFAGTEFTQSGSILDPVATVTLTSSGSAATARVAGSPFTIKASRPVGTNLQNYRFAYVSGSMSVSKAALTITASDQQKLSGKTGVFMRKVLDGVERIIYRVYDTDGVTILDEVQTVFTMAPDPLLNSDTVTLSSPQLDSDGLLKAAPDAIYPITIAAATGTGLDNYDITYVPGNLVVSPNVWRFVQSAIAQMSSSTPGGSPSDAHPVFPANVTAGSLLVAIVSTAQFGTLVATGGAITDSLGQTWTPGATDTFSRTDIFANQTAYRIRLYYFLNTVAGAVTVTFTPVGSTDRNDIIIAEYIGGTVNTLDSAGNNTGSNATGETTATTATVAVNFPGELIVAAHMAADFGGTDAIFATSPFTLREDCYKHGLLQPLACPIALSDHYAVDVGEACTFTMTPLFPGFPDMWATIIASFKKS